MKLKFIIYRYNGQVYIYCVKTKNIKYIVLEM